MGSAISGTFGAETYDDGYYCGTVYYQVAGNGSGGSFTLNTSNPSGDVYFVDGQPYNYCGIPLASTETDKISLSGGSCGAGSGLLTSNINPSEITTTFASTTPTFLPLYASYIPANNIMGPRPCVYTNPSNPSQTFPWELLYKGDGNFATYRTSEAALAVPDVAYVGTDDKADFFADTGETRNYGYGSPANGSSLSIADEDNVPDDCYLWNNQGKASTAGLLPTPGTFPTSSQAIVTFNGASGNPLEPFGDLIQWNIKTTINDSSPQSPTAQVTATHTCYPAHIVQVNGTTVYSYTPPSNSILYAGPCLYGIGMVNAATGQVPVPSH